jgi:hypothetical protein
MSVDLFAENFGNSVFMNGLIRGPMLLNRYGRVFSIGVMIPMLLTYTEDKFVIQLISNL